MQLIKLAFSYKFQWLLSLVLMLSFYPPIASAVAAPEFELLKSLGKRDGKPVDKPVLDAEGNLYGMTEFGGSNGLGTIYIIDTSGAHKVLFSFDGVNGAYPGANRDFRGTNNTKSTLIRGTDGKFFGITSFGGSSFDDSKDSLQGHGTVFQLDTSGTTPIFTVLHSFDGTDGTPTILIRGRDGKLYGTTYDLLSEKAVVFQLDLSGATPVYAVLHEFDPPPPDGPFSGGATSLIQSSNGKLYGVDPNGGDFAVSYYPGKGGTFRQGALFELDITGAIPVYTTLHKFDGTDNTYNAPNGPDFICLDPHGNPDGICKDDNSNKIIITPVLGIGALMESSDGKLYGTTYGENPSTNTVFKLDISGVTPIFTTLTTLDTGFGGSNGLTPPLLQGSDGKLYGTTNTSFSKGGTVFRIDSSGSYTVLLSLRDIGLSGSSNLVQGSDGKLYGTAFEDSFNNSRISQIVFQLDISGKTPKYSAVFSTKEFESISLIPGNSGKIYGTLKNRRSGGGAVFQLDTAGAAPVFSFLHKFDTNPGVYPNVPLVEGNDGKFYGTTLFGGSRDSGTVFRLDISGPEPVYNILHEFDSGNFRPGFPAGDLILANNGKFFYGIFDTKIMFKLDVSGATPDYKVAYVFDDTSSPPPSNGLFQGSDGKFYGISTSNTLFQLDIFKTTPIYKVLYKFDNTFGSPQSLIQGSDGKFYGTTFADGSKGGTVFQLDTSGATPTFKMLFQFDGMIGILSGLIRGSDGKLYGTTYNAPCNQGTIYRLDLSGVTPAYSLLHKFDSTNGGYPISRLTQGSDGKLYGTTNSGGSASTQFVGLTNGTVFQLDISGEEPVYKVLHEVEDSASSNNRLVSGVIQGSDGNLYGASTEGGQYGGGFIYRIRMPSVNTPPVATNDSFALIIPRRNAPVTVAAPGVLGNDKDAEGKALTVVGAKGATSKTIEFSEGGTVALYADGHFTYTPGKKCFYGTRSFTYQATDGQNASNSATMTLTTKRRNHEHHGHKYGNQEAP